jgi:hypothetical protein
VKSQALYLRLLLLVFALTAAAAFFFSRPSFQKTESWLPSSFNSAPAGHEAFFVSLQKSHWPVHRWHRPYRDLTGSGAVMFLTRSAQHRKTPYSPDELTQLLSWVQTGNRLVLLGDFQDWSDTQSLLQQLGFTLPPSPSPLSRWARGGSSLFLSSNVPRELKPAPSTGSIWPPVTFSLPSPSPLPKLPPGATVLWQDAKQDPYIVEIPWQAGSVVWIASPSLIANESLDSSAWPLLLSLLQPAGRPPSAIYFEERHHGFPTSYAWGNLWDQDGLRIASGQIVLGFLVLFASSLQRFGPVQPVQRQRARSTLEFVRSMAHLYRRANLRNEIVQQLFDETRQRVLLKFNLPPRATPDQVGRRLQQAFPHLPKWKKLAERFELKQSPAGLPPGGWLQAARDLIQIKREML